MRLLGIAFALGGFALAVGGLFITGHNFGRAIFACLGIAVSLVGSLGIINRYHLSKAIWKQ